MHKVLFLSGGLDSGKAHISLHHHSSRPRLGR